MSIGRQGITSPLQFIDPSVLPLTATLQTNDATFATIATYNVAVGEGAMISVMSLVGLSVDNTKFFTATLTKVSQNIGGVPDISEPEQYGYNFQNDAGLEIRFIAPGPNQVALQVKGLLGQIINWKAVASVTKQV
jgi:hypothetical protein